MQEHALQQCVTTGACMFGFKHKTQGGRYLVRMTKALQPGGVPGMSSLGNSLVSVQPAFKNIQNVLADGRFANTMEDL